MSNEEDHTWSSDCADIVDVQEKNEDTTFVLYSDAPGQVHHSYMLSISSISFCIQSYIFPVSTEIELVTPLSNHDAPKIFDQGT